MKESVSYVSVQMNKMIVIINRKRFCVLCLIISTFALNLYLYYTILFENV